MTPGRSVLVFFVASLVLTAACQTPGILALRSGAQPGGLAMLLMVIGSSGPSLVAVALSLAAGGGAAVRTLFARRGRASWQLSAVALLHVPAAHLIASAVLVLIGRYASQHVVYLPLRPEQIAIAIVAPLGEEYGWRGYALPRLQAVMKPLPASLLIGAVWALWHLPTLFAPGAAPVDLLRSLPLMLAGSVIYTWLYNASGGSMGIILLAHLGIHLDNVFRAAALGDGWMPLYSTSALLIAFASVLIARGGLRGGRAIRVPAERNA